MLRRSLAFTLLMLPLACRGAPEAPAADDPAGAAAIANEAAAAEAADAAAGGNMTSNDVSAAEVETAINR